MSALKQSVAQQGTDFGSKLDAILESQQKVLMILAEILKDLSPGTIVSQKIIFAISK